MEIETSAVQAVELQEIRQIGLTVSDLERAKDFYGKTLGLRFLFDAGTMAFFQCGTVRLMLGWTKEAVPASGTILYFKVGDIQASHEALMQKGAAFVDEPHLVARMASHDLWMVFLRDPDGNPMGLMSEVTRTSSAS